MHDRSEVFDDLTATAQNEQDLNLIEKYVKGEKLRDWLLYSKEGQAISEQLEYMYCRALDDFANCESTDITGLQKAKIDLIVTSRIFDVFNGIFQESESAEVMLTEE